MPLPRPGPGSSAQSRVEVLAGDLRFSKLSLEDSGMYQCVAENKHGTIYASAELAVQGKGGWGHCGGDRLGSRGGVTAFLNTKHTPALSSVLQRLLSRNQGFEKRDETLD